MNRKESLKISKQELTQLILNLDEYTYSYKQYNNLKQNGLTLCWLSFLAVPAIIGSILPQLEYFLLGFILIGGLLGLKIMPIINNYLIKTYLNKINKSLGQRVHIYQKYHRKIKDNIIITLNEGSDGNFTQKVIIKTLAQC